MLTLHPHMRRVGKISFVGVRSDQICSFAPVTVPVVLMPQFNRLASWCFYTFSSTLRESLYHTPSSTQKLSPLNCTPAERNFFPSLKLSNIIYGYILGLLLTIFS